MRHLAVATFNNPYVLLPLATLFWGGNFVLGRGVHEFFPPIALASLRWTLAFLFILPFAWARLREDWPVLKQHWPWLLFFGATGGGSFNTLSYIGLNYTPALNALVMNSSGPIMIAIASFIFFRERLTPVQLLGIVISFIGVASVVSKGDFSALAALQLNIGDLWVLAAMMIWGIYTAYLRKKPRMHWLSFAAATFFFAGAVNWPFHAWEHVWVRQVSLSTDSLLAIGYVSIFPSIFSYVLYNRSVELIGGNRTGPFLHLIPLFGSVMAVLTLGEVPGLYHAVGFTLILSGVAIATRRPRS
jgi:drug/metabolite transporter (DMT)-like permease